MSQPIIHITSSESVTEWLTPRDERLMRVTGLLPPVDAKSLREDWNLKKSELPHLYSAVKRLIVPNALEGIVNLSIGTTSFHPEEFTGLINIDFEKPEDWRLCLPAVAETLVFERNGVRGNAAIALCGQTAALAVINMDFYEQGEQDFVVAPIKQDKLAEILAA